MTEEEIKKIEEEIKKIEDIIRNTFYDSTTRMLDTLWLSVDILIKVVVKQQEQIDILYKLIENK